MGAACCSARVVEGNSELGENEFSYDFSLSNSTASMEETEELVANMHSGSITTCSYDSEPSNGQDMISNLPDSIIGRILDFLPIKDAVRTSVLSWRWVYMWTFVTKLNFYDNEYPFFSCERKKTSFTNFVSRVLLHLNSRSIQEFSLHISQKIDHYLINQWISSVSSKTLKKICVRSWDPCNLNTYPLFKCQSLEELVLDMMINSNIKIPTFVCLSSLTILGLYGVTFTSYSSSKSKEITLNFPVLKEYKINDCIWLDVKSVTVEAPLLEVVSLSYSESHAEIKFCASQLKKFCYHGDISAETIVLDAHIDSTNIELIHFKETSVQETWDFVYKLLRINAKCSKLWLKADWQYLLAGAENYLAYIPKFGMLGYLELSYVTSEVLLGLLLKSPCLETLVFKMLDVEEEPNNYAIVPKCFLDTLKVVEFERFSGKERELSFAKFVMENARVLERISFLYSNELCDLELEKVKEKLLLVKRSSSIVIVEYEKQCYGRWHNVIV